MCSASPVKNASCPTRLPARVARDASVGARDPILIRRGHLLSEGMPLPPPKPLPDPETQPALAPADVAALAARGRGGGRPSQLAVRAAPRRGAGEADKGRRLAARLRPLLRQPGALALVAVRAAARELLPVARAGLGKGVGAAGEIAEGGAAVAPRPGRGLVGAPFLHDLLFRFFFC